jgi:hypothetical protein
MLTFSNINNNKLLAEIMAFESALRVAYGKI